MASTGAYINQAELDKYNIVWAVGRSLNRFDGNSSEYYTNLNSAVPGNGPYFLDTRSISIDEDSNKWVGCAYSSQFTSTPLVFTVEGQYAAAGSSWSPLEIVGTTGSDLEVSTIFASPFGEEVLAFITPLNGGYGTGPVGVYGVTGGNLYCYNKVLGSWTEAAPEFIWPHIYDIEAKGIGGATFEYYMATIEGIYIIPPGVLDVLQFEGGSPYVSQAKIWNSRNTSLPSDIIYSLDFDENGNLWIGTDNGIVYWDQSKFYVWNTSNLPGLLSNQIYEVKSRPNGHVFFSAGNPQKGEGTGLYYFNGDTLINYNTGNSDLVSDDIFSIMLVERKSNSNGLQAYENDIFVASGNSVGLFDYTIPHIYATSKYTGTTGWNFVYYTPTTEALPTDEAKLPKANKYTWDYPTWRNYQDSYLQYKHPGLDPRNLFLEANLKAIADGRAGEQDYWNLGRTPTFDSSQISKSLQNSSWINGITGGSTITTSATYIGGKYVIGGYSKLNQIYFGPKNNLENLILTNPNPTSSNYTRGGSGGAVITTELGFLTPGSTSVPLIGINFNIQIGQYVTGTGIAPDTYVQNIVGGSDLTLSKPALGSGTVTLSFRIPPQNVGYVAYYNEAGQVQDVLPIRGYETEVWDIQSSPDESSLYVLGSYKGYVEAGELIWSSTYPGAAGLTGGPTGGPIGFSNIQSPGITGSPYEYPWIFDGTQTIPATGPYLPSTGPIDTLAEGLFLMEIEKNIGSQSSYGGIDFGVTGEFSSSYRLKQFRSFPAASSSYNPSSSSSSVDTTLYEKTVSMSVSDYEVSLVGTLEGGVATYKDVWDNYLDAPSTQNFLFSPWDGSSYLKSGFWISLGTEMELLKSEVSSGTGGNVIFNSIQRDQGTLTYLITGSSSSYSFNFSGTGISGGVTGSTGPFYMIINNSPSVSSYSFIQTNSAPLDDFQGIDSSIKDGKYYWSTFYSGTGSFGTKSISEEADYNGYSSLTAVLTPSESSVEVYTNKILPVNTSISKIGIDDLEIGEAGQRCYSIFTEGPTAANYIWKVGLNGSLDGSFSLGGTGHIRLALDYKDSLFMAGYRIGETGPSGIPINSSSFDASFSALSEQYVPGIGIDLGNIISRAGSGAWTWADVHNSNSDIFVPILSTVFFTNYASQIFGKQNNRWILTDEVSGTVILDVKSIPYFIFTFTESGYYSIQNSVEDSGGNVYSITKKAFVKVVDQSVPVASDPNPEFVNSVDYGYPPLSPASSSSIFQLSKYLIEQQGKILRDSRKTFGSGLIIKNDPNSTFDGN